MKAKPSLKDALIGNPQTSSLEIRVINAITLIVLLIGILKTVSNAILYNYWEAAVALVMAGVAGASYLYVRRTRKWQKAALPLCLFSFCALAVDWLIDPLATPDGYFFLLVGGISAIILKPKWKTPFAVMIGCVIILVFAIGLIYHPQPFKEIHWQDRMIDAALSLLLSLTALVVAVRMTVTEHRRVFDEMLRAHAQIKVLRGYLPICSKCKKIRDEAGEWRKIESYIAENSEADFTHTVCPECGEELLDEFNHYNGLGSDWPPIPENQDPSA